VIVLARLLPIGVRDPHEQPESHHPRDEVH
jgi:hypothetical protein